VKKDREIGTLVQAPHRALYLKDWCPAAHTAAILSILRNHTGDRGRSSRPRKMPHHKQHRERVGEGRWWPFSRKRRSTGRAPKHVSGSARGRLMRAVAHSLCGRGVLVCCDYACLG
jgi:hypothetical protein